MSESIITIDYNTFKQPTDDKQGAAPKTSLQEPLGD